MAEPASIVRLETVTSDMIELRPLRDLARAPGALERRRPAIVLAPAIMSLAQGFARDGIGASSLGFEIFVRWTSLKGHGSPGYLVRPDLLLFTAGDGSMASIGALSPISGWTRVLKVVQI